MSTYTYPGRRMGYDRDGSVCFFHTGVGPITTLSTADMQGINGDPGTGWNVAAATGFWGVIFPELRDVVALGTHIGAATSTLTVESSTDTTNGLDGTWTTQSTGSIPNGAAAGAWDYSPPLDLTRLVTGAPFPLNGIRALRLSPSSIGGDKHWYGLAVYGNIASGQTPDRLRLWHASLDQEVDANYFNWGDIARGSSGSIQFRVKNNSATLIAHTVSLINETNTDAAPSVIGQLVLSSTSFATIAATALTSAITLTRNTTTGAQLGLWFPRVVASAASFST